MRLIDADALIEKLLRTADIEWNQNTGTTWAMAYEEVAETVDDQPTINPVKRGRWIKAERHGCWSYADVYKQCSECGKVTFLAGKMNYCPSCGAKMDEVTE